jgi:hypothetical protein
VPLRRYIGRIVHASRMARTYADAARSAASSAARPRSRFAFRGSTSVILRHAVNGYLPTARSVRRDRSIVARVTPEGVIGTARRSHRASNDRFARTSVSARNPFLGPQESLHEVETGGSQPTFPPDDAHGDRRAVAPVRECAASVEQMRGTHKPDQNAEEHAREQPESGGHTQHGGPVRMLIAYCEGDQSEKHRDRPGHPHEDPLMIPERSACSAGGSSTALSMT